MHRHFSYITPVGEFRITQEPSGRWQAMFQDEGLGSYATPAQAAEDLAGGHTFWPSIGDTSRLGLPDDLHEWTASDGR